MEPAQIVIITAKAQDVLQKASSHLGIKASANNTDNYNRIWARDSVVTGLAILTNEISSLYHPYITSLKQLQKAAAQNGQIPSNISVNENGEIQEVSFGGPVGRTDCNFWWVIGSIIYLKQIVNTEFKQTVYNQCLKIFGIAESWEFNQKGLMYLPVSANWADEYVTGGYVLYDQLLRYWAMVLAGDYYSKEEWKEKATGIRSKIKQHYCFETEPTNSLFTVQQKERVKNFDISDNFISSFTPTQLIDKYDCWSIALLLLLKIPEAATIKKLTEKIKTVFEENGSKGLPAFWPLIEEKDLLYQELLSNYSFRFKNNPGHFHNGGIWPVTNSFLITALFVVNDTETALLLKDALNNNLFNNIDHYPFAEYFALKDASPQGVNQLCFSAAGFLLAHKTQENILKVKSILGIENNNALHSASTENEITINRICEMIPFKKGKVLAISVAGESGCGKTTLSNRLQQALEKAGYNILILHQDDYFKLPPRKNHEQRLIDFNHIGAHEVELDTLDSDIDIVKKHAASVIRVPVMNWATDIKEYKELNANNIDVILVDGTYTTLLNNVDYRIFMNATYLQTRNNRITRNREPITDFIEKVLSKESDIIQSHQGMADIIINDRSEIIKKG